MASDYTRLGSNLVLDSESLAQASTSWNPRALKTRPTRFEAVVRPESAEVARVVLDQCAQEGWSVAAIGGGSGTGEPSIAQIGLDTSALRAVTLNELDLCVEAEAGVTIEVLEEDLARHGYTLGQTIGSAALATVGGCITTDAVGLFSGRYGRFRDIVLSTETCQGIILSATLAIRPAPEVRAWAVFGYSNDEDAIDALRLIYRSDSRPALAHAADGLLVLAFEGEELTQAGNYQLAHAVCQQIGLTPRDSDEGEIWLQEQQRDSLWSQNAQEGVWADRVNLRVSWSIAKETLRAARQILSAPEVEPRLALRHPDPHGVTLALGFVAHTSERGWTTLRESLLQLREF
ncbi:MAG: FAD-binding oxidoreductase [Armatimonas sp.]